MKETYYVKLEWHPDPLAGRSVSPMFDAETKAEALAVARAVVSVIRQLSGPNGRGLRWHLVKGTYDPKQYA